MTDTWNEHANGWDDNSDVKFYADHAFRSLVAITDIRNPGWTPKRVLDFGCGTGLFGQALRLNGFANIDGVDLSADMLAQAKGKNIYASLAQIEQLVTIRDNRARLRLGRVRQLSAIDQ